MESVRPEIETSENELYYAGEEISESDGNSEGSAASSNGLLKSLTEGQSDNFLSSGPEAGLQDYVLAETSLAKAADGLSAGGGTLELNGIISNKLLGELLKYEESIPDGNFRAYLESKIFPQVTEALKKAAAADSGSQAAKLYKYMEDNGFSGFPLTVDGVKVLPMSIVKMISGLSLSENGIKSVEGLKYFTGLKRLSVRGLGLTSLDVSTLTVLEVLDCSHNSLTELDLSKNTLLTTLDCAYNRLRELDLSHNPKLAVFACTFNLLEILDLRGNKALTPFKNLTFNVAFQSGSFSIICDSVSELVRYCEMYLIPYAYSILPKRPAFGTVSEPQVVVVKEKADIGQAIGLMADGEPASAYSLSDKKYARINKKGILKGKKEGELIVTAKTGKGSIECPVRVVKASFSKKTVESVSMGQVIYGLDYLKGIDYRPDSWISSNEEVAEVHPLLGKVTVKKRGSARITALYGSGKNAAKISFTLKTRVPKLSKTSLYLKVGENYTLKLRNYKGAAYWYSTDQAVVSAGSGGELTGISPGTAKVRAVIKDGPGAGGEYECVVTVVKRD
ncbi:MAG: Ig-like domain-containing protein [Lachnospiraceae bacterium]|nr:Ig-like domain-containing protein [Lachnospiraceae bacterium]